MVDHADRLPLQLQLQVRKRKQDDQHHPLHNKTKSSCISNTGIGFLFLLLFVVVHRVEGAGGGGGDPCTSAPCTSDGTCVSNTTSDTYICQCLSPQISGTQCQLCTEAIPPSQILYPNISNPFSAMGVDLEFGIMVKTNKNFTFVFTQEETSTNMLGSVYIYQLNTTTEELVLFQFISSPPSGYEWQDGLYDATNTKMGISISLIDSPTQTAILIYEFNTTLNEFIPTFMINQTNLDNLALSDQWLFLGVNVITGSGRFINVENVILIYERNPLTLQWIETQNISLVTLPAVSPASDVLVMTDQVTNSIVYVYLYDSLTGLWYENQNFTQFTDFISAFAITNTTIVVGYSSADYDATMVVDPSNYNNNATTVNAGLVRVFTRFPLSNIFAYNQTLYEPNPQSEAECGLSIAIRDTTIVAGCPSYVNSLPPFDPSQGCIPEGVVEKYTYNFTTRAWTWQHEFTEVCHQNPTQCFTDFGYSVSTSQNNILIGAPFDNSTFGRVYFYPYLCSNSSCQNGGSCNISLSSTLCQCSNGFSGGYCQTNIDDCVNVTCLHGGTCVDGVHSFSCSCANGYFGLFCNSSCNVFLFVSSLLSLSHFLVPVRSVLFFSSSFLFFLTCSWTGATNSNLVLI
jgi:EGF-like domain